MLRAADDGDFATIAAVINDGARAYRGVIPGACWHEPYMDDDELAADIAAGVRFTLLEHAGEVVAVMGSQARGDVLLIRHAYVRRAVQGHGHGTRLLRHLVGHSPCPVLIGTWAAAHWAVAFYVKHGFHVVDPHDKDRLLARYWTVPARQVAHSVVLADASFTGS